MTTGLWLFILFMVLCILVVGCAAWIGGRASRVATHSLLVHVMDSLGHTQALLRQIQENAMGIGPGPAISVAPCQCHILWHASDATNPGTADGAATNIHLLTFTDREERVWIDARDPIRVKFLDMDPTCFADAAEMSDTAVLRVFADYHVDVHYPETREWMRQVMRRGPQGAFVFQVPAETIVVGGVVYIRDGKLQPLSPGELSRVSRILRKARLRPCYDYENPPSCPDAAASGQAILMDD